MTTPAPGQAPTRGERYFSNVLWSWLGVAANLFAAIALSPYIIHKLGAEAYGLWALLFSVAGYFGFLDFGFRAAIVRYSAHFHAREEPDRINDVINSALAYFLVAALVTVVGAVYLSRSVDRLFDIPPAYQAVFSSLILIVGVTWALSMLFGVFGGSLEGFQRFDYATQIRVTVVMSRSLANVAVLAIGKGLLAMGVMTLASQVLASAASYLRVRRIFPQLRFSVELVKWSTLKTLAGYGIHAFVANIAELLLTYTPALLIGHFLPVAYVGYYALPDRLLQYASDFGHRAGLVTGASAADLSARGSSASVAQLGIYSNRYCLVLFMPLTVALLAYGREVLEAWVGPAFAAYSAPLLPILVTGSTFAVAAQFNSTTILFGLGKHRAYAYGLLAEAAASVVGMTLVIPRYGTVGAAWVASVLMILMRGLVTPWLLCRTLNFSPVTYLGSIVTRPVLTAVPVFALAYGAKLHVLPGHRLLDLLAIGIGVSALYYGAAVFTCLQPEHRQLAFDWIARRCPRLVRSRGNAASR